MHMLLISLIVCRIDHDHDGCWRGEEIKTRSARKELKAYYVNQVMTLALSGVNRLKEFVNFSL